MKRCPIHGPRVDTEFKRVAQGVPPATGQGATLDVWKHHHGKCGEFVWVMSASEKRILRAEVRA